MKQTRAPIFEAVKKHSNNKIIPFHVPGHKGGGGLPELRDYIGEHLMAIDLTCMPDLDNICSPKGVIHEAEKLAANLYGADHAFFLTNGTTQGIQAMIMSVCAEGDKIILPRNAHKSALGGLILSGALPLYINPEINEEFGISMGITPKKVRETLEHHPDTKGVFLIYPNYYGTASHISEIVEISHSFDVPVLVDEAHGAHLKFNKDLPISSLEAGADLTASSTHKLTGSLTQSSMLFLQKDRISPQKVKKVLNLTQTTSPSYILLSSLDLARKQMAIYGEKLVERAIEISHWIRSQLMVIEGCKIFGEGIVGNPGCHDYDPTKVTLNVQGLGFSGYEVESILREKYRIQVELSDLYNVIFLVSIGDTWENAFHLVGSMKKIALQKTYNGTPRPFPPLPKIPKMIMSPREAFYSPTKVINLENSVGEISAEPIMVYPPGIPLLCPGEIISQEIIDYIGILKSENADLQGPIDQGINKISVLTNCNFLDKMQIT